MWLRLPAIQGYSEIGSLLFTTFVHNDRIFMCFTSFTHCFTYYEGGFTNSFFQKRQIIHDIYPLSLYQGGFKKRVFSNTQVFEKNIRLIVCPGSHPPSKTCRGAKRPGQRNP